MDYKAETKRTYNTYAKIFEQKFGEHFELRVKDEADLFLKHLNGKRILDVGAGPGSHAIYFQDKGYDVHCIDLSEEMVELCRSKELKAEVMDVEDLQFPDNSFDGIWAYAVLLHVPKNKVQQIVEKMKSMLKPEGLLAIALQEGSSEGFVENEKYPNTKRWFSYFINEEVRKLCADMELLHASKTNVKNKYIFINYIFRKSPQQ